MEKLFSQAKITGLDLHVKEDWFKDEKTSYRECDQSNPKDLNDIRKSLENPLLLIDDGSHIPHHQLIFLDIALQNALKNKSKSTKYVIIEDIHTSLEYCLNSRNNSFFKKIIKIFSFKENKSCPFINITNIVNPLSIIYLSIKIKSGIINKKELDFLIKEFSLNQMPNEENIIKRIINNLLKSSRLKIYKRSKLPDKCFKCNSRFFNFQTLMCLDCNEDLIKNDDSMLAIITLD